MNSTHIDKPFEVSFTFQRKNERKKATPERLASAIRNGNIPRVSRLLALAIRFEGLIRRGEVHDYADLARLGYVSRARVTQIMNLLNLAPDLQEDILYLPNTTEGRDLILEKDLRPIASVLHWQRQRNMWEELRKERLDRKCL